MILELSDYTISTDPTINRAYYEIEQTIYDADPNDDTKNFELTIKGINKDVQEFFNKLGVDIMKPIEIYASYEEHSIITYEGYYHIHGEIISGESPWETFNEGFSSLNEDAMHAIGNSFLCGFSKECTLLLDEFPRPCFQMEVIIKLPRVIK